MAENASLSNPPSSQVMPKKIKESVEKAEAEMKELNDRWWSEKAKQNKIIEAIEQKQRSIRMLQNKIPADNVRTNNIGKQFKVMKEKIDAKVNWVESCK